jgi:hypothetical protein
MSESVSNALFATLLILVATRMMWQLASSRGRPEHAPERPQPDRPQPDHPV